MFLKSSIALVTNNLNQMIKTTTSQQMAAKTKAMIKILVETKKATWIKVNIQNRIQLSDNLNSDQEPTACKKRRKTHLVDPAEL